MRSLRILFIIAIGVSFLGAEEYYVSPTGNDSDAGTAVAPWRTLSKAVEAVEPGDTVFLGDGIYAERLTLDGISGTALAPITIRARAGEIPVIDGDTLTVPTGGRQGLVVLEDCSHIRVEGLEVRNFVTTINGRIPVGIQIEGSGSGVEIVGCKVHRIWQSSTNANANGFGISVYGTSLDPIDGLLLEGNEVFNLRTGQSESVVLNGNVTNFLVTKNHVYDCNNIGIDFIGYEGSAPAAVDRARNGVCSENLVHGIDSRFNPGYGGDFITGGGGGSAAGIYVDGGRDIQITGNRVYGCNFGIELASENPSGFTENIEMTSNLLHHNLGPGIIMGGYDSNRGKTRNCVVANNTLYRNDTLVSYGGQIALQFYVEGNTFVNNIIWASETTGQMIINYVLGGNAAQRSFPTSNVFDYNLYHYGGAAGSIEFGVNLTGNGAAQGNTAYYGLPAWRAAVGGEANSVFVNPGFTVPIPSSTPAAGDFRPVEGAPGMDAGWPAPGFVPSPGAADFAGVSRVGGGRVDLGAFEYQTDFLIWLDQYFSQISGFTGSENDDDPDFDGVKNLLEYSQGMNPSVTDSQLAPSGSIEVASEGESDSFRFSYRKAVPELQYTVMTSTDLENWSAAIPSEHTDDAGLFWRDFPVSEDSLFVRLEVTE